MNQALPLIPSLLALLAASRIGGELMERLKQPAMIGELAAGALLGPAVLGWIHPTQELRVISDLGVFLLVLLAGMEIDPRELGDTLRDGGYWVAVSSFVIPVLIGAGIGAVFGLDIYRVAFLGLCIAITALPVSVRILMDLGRLQTDVGRRILSAAVFNDIAALLLLGVILGMKGEASSWGGLAAASAWTAGKAIVFTAGIVAAYRLILRSTGPIPVARERVDRLLASLKSKETLFALALLFVMVFASFSEVLGLHSVIGGFFGAMLLSREFLGRENFESVRRTASTVTLGFLAPVFFAVVGLEFNPGAIVRPWLLFAVLAGAFAGKIAGGYIGGRLAGLSPETSWTLGIGLNARGMMELLIANIAYANGFIGPNLFSILVLMGAVTTVSTPWLLKGAFARIPRAA